MKKSAKTIGSVAAGLGLIAVVAMSLGQFPSLNHWKAKRVSHAVLKLPVGSSQTQVASFLKSEGLEHSYISDKQDIDFTSDVSRNGFSSKVLSGYMVAIIRNTSFGFLIMGDVQYFFFFDKKGKLLKATAKDVYTGP